MNYVRELQKIAEDSPALRVGPDISQYSGGITDLLEIPLFFLLDVSGGMPRLLRPLVQALSWGTIGRMGQAIRNPRMLRQAQEQGRQVGGSWLGPFMDLD